LQNEEARTLTSTLSPLPSRFLGGDEVQPTCFNASSEQRAWLQKHNRTADGMETYFFEEVARRVLPKLPGNKTFG